MNLAVLPEKIENGFPRIAMIYPTSSIVQHDFQREIKDGIQRFAIEEIRIPFNSEQQLLSTLRSADGNAYDVICLVRGGGNDFGALESQAVLKEIVEMSTPTIAAIGHENDKLFINEIVDMAFSTPTSLGGYFKRLVDDYNKKQYQVQQLRDNLRENDRTIDDLRTKLKKAIWAIVSVSTILIGTFIYFYTR